MYSTLGVTRSYEKLSLPAVAMEDKGQFFCKREQSQACFSYAECS